LSSASACSKPSTYNKSFIVPLSVYIKEVFVNR